MTEWHSPEIAELCDALSKAQGAMGAATKDSTATVRGKSKDGRDVEYTYKYATLADCWEIARPPLSANGLSLTQLPFTTEGGSLALRSILLHKSGQWIKTEHILPVIESEKANPHQADGIAMSYAKRYHLCAICGIPTEDDDGASASNIGDKRAPSPVGTIPFGKHRGKPWADASIDYLQWAATTDNAAMSGPAKVELQLRLGQPPKHSDADPPVPHDMP